MEISRLSNHMMLINSKGYGPEDPDWVQFVSDHKSWLIANSEVKQFTAYDLGRYKYRPREFAIDKAGYDLGAYWIILFVNDIRSPDEFNESITQLRIPRSDIIIQLRKLYEQTAFSRT